MEQDVISACAFAQWSTPLGSSPERARESFPVLPVGTLHREPASALANHHSQTKTETNHKLHHVSPTGPGTLMPNISALHAEFMLTGSAETAAQLRKEMLRYVTKILRVYYSEAFDTVMVKERSGEEEPPTDEKIADQERESEFQGKTATLPGIPDIAYQIVNDITMNRNEKGAPLFRGVSGQFTKFVETFTRWTVNNLIRNSYVPHWEKERAKTPHAPAKRVQADRSSSLSR
jgi:hypothetical protein